MANLNVEHQNTHLLQSTEVCTIGYVSNAKEVRKMPNRLICIIKTVKNLTTDTSGDNDP